MQLESVRDEKQKSIAKRRINSRWLVSHPIKAAVGLCVTSVPLIAWAVLAVEAHVPEASIRTYHDSLWWAIGTALSMGYGHFVPVSHLGRLLAVLLMAISFLSFAVVGGRVIALALARRLKR